MNVGKRNRLVTIRSRTVGEDEAGQPLNTWTVRVAQAWADIRYQRGLESIKGGAVTATAQASINIAYREDLTADMRVEYGSTVFAIKAILPDVSKRNGVDLVVESVT